MIPSLPGYGARGTQGFPVGGCPFPGLAVRLRGDTPTKEEHEVRVADPSGDHRRPRAIPRPGTSSPRTSRSRSTPTTRRSTRRPGVTPDTPARPPETATTVRVEDGKTLTTDGPFVSVKEALGGWLVFEADDLDAAIELAARIPAARMGGGIEIRPIVGG